MHHLTPPAIDIRNEKEYRNESSRSSVEVLVKRIERIEKISRILEEKGNISIVYLAKVFNVSQSSVRRDLSYMLSLPKYKNIERVHGGILLDVDKKKLEFMFELKVDLNRELKKNIAKKAIELVQEGDSIIIDSGTTCLYFAELLGTKKRIRAITTDIKIAEELGKYEDMESSMIGGLIRPGYYTVGGNTALEHLGQFYADKAFMSVDSISVKHGLTNASEFEVGVKKKIIQTAKQIILLADSTKFNKNTLYKICDISRIHIIVTNRNLDEENIAAIRDVGINLILA